jgi:hypothetical protein
MPQKLSWDEIRRQYPDEWVVLTDHRIDGIDIVEGIVVDHGAVKAEVYARLRNSPNGSAVLYTGEIRHGLVGLSAIDMDDER